MATNAGSVIDLTSFSNSLRVTGFFDKQQKQYIIQQYLLDKFQRGGMSLKADGRTSELPVETRGTTSFGAQLEHERVSLADAPEDDLGSVINRTITSVFQLSLQVHEASKSDRSSWVKARMRGLNTVAQMFGQHLSRVLWGIGDGALAAVHASTAVQLNTPVAGTHRITLEADQGANLLYGTRFMLRGQRLVNSTAANRSGTGNHGTADLMVVAVNRTAGTIDVRGTVGDLALGDILFIGGQGRSSKGRMPVGIFAAVDDGTSVATYHGIDRTAAGKDYWQAYRYNSIGSSDLETFIQRACDDVYTTGGGMTDLALMELSVWRRFAADLRGEREYIARDDARYKAGVSLIKFSGADQQDIAIGRSRDVPLGVIAGLDLSSFHLSELKPAGWLKEFDEASIFRWISDTLDWEAIYCFMGNLVCGQPNANWIGRGVTGAS